MPLRCIDSTGQSIHSFDLSADEWQALASENKKARHLKMPCCASLVTMKRSRLGTPFFVHKAVGSCTAAPETESHLILKRMAVEAAQANGWKAETEIAGTTPAGKKWKADVLAEKGNHKVAVEVQWSGQTDDQAMRRQATYKESGIRGLWLLRQPGFVITRDLPAICIGGSLRNGFKALIPAHSCMNARDRKVPDEWHQIVCMDKFLDAAFRGCFRYGVPLNVAATVSIWGTEMWCWSCGAETLVVTRIEIKYGQNTCNFSVADLGEYPEIVSIVLRQIPQNLRIGSIKFRFSKSIRASYLSNGCAHCDALLGEHYVFPENGVAEEFHNFPIRLSHQWRQAVERRVTEKWSVYPTAALPNAIL